MSYVPPTQPMDRYARSLLSERTYPDFGDDASARLAEYQRRLDARELDKFELMGIIDYLKVAPLDTESGLKVGVYQRNGEIFVVKLNRQKTNKYVTKLIELTGSARRLNEPGDHVPIDFVYAPGMLAKLRPDDQMTLAQARPFIIKYGRCLFCGQFLRAAKSVERSVGPVCFKRYAADEVTEPTVSDEQAADWLAALGG